VTRAARVVDRARVAGVDGCRGGWVVVTVDVDATVRTDGSGFEVGTQAGPRHGHFGLAGMRERVERLGGTFEIDSTPGDGTLVRAGVPPGQTATEAATDIYA